MTFLLLHVEFGFVLTFEPVSTTTVVSGAIASVAFAGYKYLHCKVEECCDDSWITANITGEFIRFIS